MTRIPTDEEYADYDGAHCAGLWQAVGHDWHCPACRRTRRECMRWTLRTPQGRRFWGWMAGLARHHDHAVDMLHPQFDQLVRFPTTVICDQCNAADGAAKRLIPTIPEFSFSPAEIGLFVVSTPHGRHRINLAVARDVWNLHMVERGHKEFA